MKLELKHLAPYLPYGLKIKEYSHRRGDYIIIPMGLTAKNEQFCIDGDIEYGPKTQTSIGYVIGDPEVKPILRPLSDLARDYGECGDICKSIAFLDGHCCAYDEWIDSFIDYPKQDRVIQAPYEIMEILFEHHFDVFGLIDAGLAIDKNTLS